MSINRDFMSDGSCLCLFHCPNSILQYTQNIGYYCIVVGLLGEVVHSSIPVVISTWAPNSSRFWLKGIERIRRKGYANPLIVTSFENETILNQIDKDTLGLRFLRLPFTASELKKQCENAECIDEQDLYLLRQKLFREYISTTMPQLKHGKKLELANQLFVPLRAALTLDVSSEQKQMVVHEILNAGITDFWSSEEITDLRECIEGILPKTQSEEDLKNLFTQTEAIIRLLSGNSTDYKLADCINVIDSCNSYLNKIGL